MPNGPFDFPLPQYNPIPGSPYQRTVAPAIPEPLRRDPYDLILKMIEGQNQRNPLADLSSVLGSYASGAQGNRVLNQQFQSAIDQLMMGQEASKNSLGLQSQADFDRLMLTSQQDRRVGEEDAMRKLQQSSYIAGGGSSYKPTSVTMLGQQRQLPSFAGIAPRSSTPEEIQGASTLRSQMLSRLAGEGYHTPTKFEPSFTYQPTPFPGAGAGERVANVGSLIAGGLGALDLFRGENGQNILSRIPGLGRLFGAGSAGSAGTSAAGGLLPSSNFTHLTPMAGVSSGGSLMSNIMGKALPIAGAVTGGIGLVQNRGLGSNLMSGAGAGASIGSMVGGPIGTAVGAGIGAGVGALRSAFSGGPSQQEVAGRQVAASTRQALATRATPQQLQEAQQAGWANPQDALAYIVLRDATGNPSAADQLFRQLGDAEKQGPESVANIAMQIQQLLNPRV